MSCLMWLSSKLSEDRIYSNFEAKKFILGFTWIFKGISVHELLLGTERSVQGLGSYCFSWAWCLNSLNGNHVFGGGKGSLKRGNDPSMKTWYRKKDSRPPAPSSCCTSFQCLSEFLSWHPSPWTEPKSTSCLVWSSPSSLLGPPVLPKQYHSLRWIAIIMLKRSTT